VGEARESARGRGRGKDTAPAIALHCTAQTWLGCCGACQPLLPPADPSCRPAARHERFPHLASQLLPRASRLSPGHPPPPPDRASRFSSLRAWRGSRGCAWATCCCASTASVLWATPRQRSCCAPPEVVFASRSRARSCPSPPRRSSATGAASAHGVPRRCGAARRGAALDVHLPGPRKRSLRRTRRCCPLRWTVRRATRRRSM